MTWDGFNEEYWMEVYEVSRVADYGMLSLFSIEYMSAEIAAEAQLIVESTFTFDVSYPTDIVDFCLMLPVNNALESYLYILQPFSRDLWILLVIVIFYCTIMLYILLNITYYKEKHVDFFICFQQAFNIILNSSNAINFRIPSSTWMIMFLPLFIFAFTLYSFHSTYLAAFLTTILFEEDIETMDQLLKSDIKIMAVNWQFESLFEYYNITDFPYENIVNISLDRIDYIIDHRDNLNTSYGYMVPSDMWNIFAKEQELLRRPLFKLSKICYTRFYASFPIKQDTYIEQPLKYLIMLSQQFGLLKAWGNRSFRDAIRADIFHLLRDETLNDFEALSPKFFTIAFGILIGGILLSCLTFFIEILVKYYFTSKLHFKLKFKQELDSLTIQNR